jgi:hypothetical protein
MDIPFQKSEIPFTFGEEQTECVNQSPVDYFLKYSSMNSFKIMQVLQICMPLNKMSRDTKMKHLKRLCSCLVFTLRWDH